MSEDTLHGWKDIAAYVGKSVRSAQRWERELGLPTHRIKTADGQIVYARRSEIDAWRVSLDRKPGGLAALAAADEPAAAEPVPAAPPAPPPAVVTRGRRANVAWWSLGLALVVTAVWVLSEMRPRSEPGALKTLLLVGRELQARDASGQLLWSHLFDSDVTATRHKGFAPLDDSTVAIGRRDFDRDGRPDSLILIRYGPAVSLPSPIGDALMAFSDDGRLLWTARGERVLSCGGEQYSAPWTISSVIVSAEAGAPRVWAAFHHHTWWPSYVAEILPDGRQIPRYTQAGWIMSLVEWTTATGTWGVAAGVMNEPGLGSVVLFDLNGAEATLPASDPRFQCSTGSPGVTPARVVLFPNFEVPQAMGSAYAAAERVLPIGADLRVEFGDSVVVATLDADGRVRDLAASDGYWLRHEQLSSTQVITHAVATCPELLSPREVRTWTPDAGWQLGTIKLIRR